MTNDCRHYGAKVVYTDRRGREKQVVAHCDECDHLLIANIDFQGEWVDFFKEPDPTNDQAC
jgi:hypothetical protein